MGKMLGFVSVGVGRRWNSRRSLDGVGVDNGRGRPVQCRTSLRVRIRVCYSMLEEMEGETSARSAFFSFFSVSDVAGGIWVFFLFLLGFVGATWHWFLFV